MQKIYDFIIVGSGASGGVMAYYLTQAGAKCLLIEAGKAFDSNTFPDNDFHAYNSMLWHGGIDPNTSGNIFLVRAKTLGGGTVVNQADLDRFDQVAFDDWYDHSNIKFFSCESMRTHYEAVEDRLAIQEIPRELWNKNAELYTKGFEQCGFKWSPLHRGQYDCALDKGNDCIVCLNGCPRNSKQSTLIRFIKQAKKNGLDIVTECSVEQIINGSDIVNIFANQRGIKKTFYARKAILAAGALGTNQLLMKSGFKHTLPALGERFFCHPQFITFAKFNDVIDSHKGPLQAVKSDDKNFRRQGFKLENVFVNPSALAILKSGFGLKHQAFMKNYRQFACIEVAIRDVGPGTLKLNRHGRLQIHKEITSEDQKRAQAGLQAVNEVFSAVGAEEVTTSPNKVGLHLMGGCAMGQSSNHSVVNENFQLHGYDNIYVTDASIFPSSPGMNPSLTIMALSHKASQAILADYGVKSSIEKNRLTAIDQIAV